jgi:hypothetical protein
MNAIYAPTALLAFALSVPALAQQVDHRLGEHPAVIVKRLHAQQSYDYARFYPHPAWLYLRAEADHAAVIVAKRGQQETLAPAGEIEELPAQF